MFQRVAILSVYLWLSFSGVDGLSLQTHGDGSRTCRSPCTTRPNAVAGSHSMVSCQSRFLGGMQGTDEAGHRRRRCSTRMDLEERFYERQLLRRVPGMASSLRHNCSNDITSLRTSVAEARHGMPWTSSIASYTPPSASNDRCGGGTSPLLFMPFWIDQMEFIKTKLTNLRPVEVDEDIAYQENSSAGARIVNHCYASDEYRKIRLTYYDNGDKLQVFNSLWYPHPRYGSLPVIGIDLLAFNRRPAEDFSGDVRGKYLSVLDFQPIHKETDNTVLLSNSLLASIRADYPSLQGTMSDRFYDHARHFSPNMLYGRCESEAFVATELAPAFKRSIQAHLSLLNSTPPDDCETSLRRSLGGQAAYDSYSSVRDPAKALFSKIFGEEWAKKYVFDFLFDLSDEEHVIKEKLMMKSARKSHTRSNTSDGTF